MYKPNYLSKFIFNQGLNYILAKKHSKSKYKYLNQYFLADFMDNFQISSHKLTFHTYSFLHSGFKIKFSKFLTKSNYRKGNSP